MKITIFTALLLFTCSSMPLHATTRTTALQQRLKDATILRVTENNSGLVYPEPEKLLLEVTNPLEVRELISHLKFDENARPWNSADFGDERLLFYNSTTQTANIIILEGYALTDKDGIWDSDVRLLSESAEFFVNWLDDRGIKGPKQNLDALNRYAEEMTPEKAEWLKVMPSSLRAFWPKMAGPFGESMTAELHRALREEYPDNRKRILVLFEWFGSGTALSKDADYELRAEQLLLDFKTGELVKALESETLNARQLEGAVRLFGSDLYSSWNREDLHLIPLPLKNILLEQARKSKYRYTRETAEEMFTPRLVE